MSMFFNSFATDSGLGLLWDPDSGSSGSNPLDWNNIINQGFAVGSQIIGAFGRNPTTQVAYNPAQNSIFAIGQSGQSYQAQNPYANMTPAQIQAYQQSLGGGVGSGIDGIVSWATRNPMIVFAGLAGAYLLFKQPPIRR